MRRSESDELFGAGIHYVLVGLAIAGFVISAAFVISVFLTKLLFRMVNELTEGEIDRNEALGLMISALVFGALGLLFVPYVATSQVSPEQTIGGLVGVGMVWGLVVGWKVMLDWWHELAMMDLPVTHFSQQLKVPRQLYPSTGTMGGAKTE